jgi:hypothetical protein
LNHVDKSKTRVGAARPAGLRPPNRGAHFGFVGGLKFRHHRAPGGIKPLKSPPNRGGLSRPPDLLIASLNHRAIGCLSHWAIDSLKKPGHLDLLIFSITQ